ncbi:hypothetical protein KFU94_30930 [Chloroflexi bacterium TSY]|nr:hypothetical protein [Chloroflexi bacterium TSY]
MKTFFVRIELFLIGCLWLLNGQPVLAQDSFLPKTDDGDRMQEVFVYLQKAEPTY